MSGDTVKGSRVKGSIVNGSSVKGSRVRGSSVRGSRVRGNIDLLACWCAIGALLPLLEIENIQIFRQVFIWVLEFQPEASHHLGLFSL